MPSSEPDFDVANERVLILTPDRNAHAKDFTGAFEPESNRLQKIYGAACTTIERVAVGRIDPKTLSVISDQQTFEASAQAVLARLGDGTPWTRVVFMCHGWQTGLQLGFRVGVKQRGSDAKNWSELVAVLKALQIKSLTLFACSAGKNPLESKTGPGSGDNSLGDRLRDDSGVPVIAHFTAGHATRNPNLIIFERSDAPLIGGITLCSPGTALFRNAAKLLSEARAAPPVGHTRHAFASLALCTSASEMQALLSSPL